MYLFLIEKKHLSMQVGLMIHLPTRSKYRRLGFKMPLNNSPAGNL